MARRDDAFMVVGSGRGRRSIAVARRHADRLACVALLTDAGWSRQRIAELLGTTVSVVGRLRGQNRPPLNP